MDRDDAGCQPVVRRLSADGPGVQRRPGHGDRDRHRGGRGRRRGRHGQPREGQGRRGGRAGDRHGERHPPPRRWANSNPNPFRWGWPGKRRRFRAERRARGDPGIPLGGRGGEPGDGPRSDHRDLASIPGGNGEDRTRTEPRRTDRGGGGRSGQAGRVPARPGAHRGGLPPVAEPPGPAGRNRDRRHGKAVRLQRARQPSQRLFCPPPRGDAGPAAGRSGPAKTGSPPRDWANR